MSECPIPGPDEEPDPLDPQEDDPMRMSKLERELLVKKALRSPIFNRKPILTNLRSFYGKRTS